jgi:hypothetical protein
VVVAGDVAAGFVAGLVVANVVGTNGPVVGPEVVVVAGLDCARPTATAPARISDSPTTNAPMR